MDPIEFYGKYRTRFTGDVLNIKEFLDFLKMISEELSHA